MRTDAAHPWWSAARVARAGLAALAATAAVAAAALALVDADAGAQGANLLPNGGFEDGLTGWVPAGTLTAEPGETAEGAMAGVLRTAVAGGAASAQSQYWHSPVEPGAEYLLTVFILDVGPDVEGVQVELQFVRDGDPVGYVRSGPPGDSASYQAVHVESGSVPADVTHVSVFVRATIHNLEAELRLDGVSLVQTVAAPAPTPTPTPTASPSPSPSATASPTPAPSVSPTPRATPTKTPSPTPTADPFASVVWPEVFNGDFSIGVQGWRLRGGQQAASLAGTDGGRSVGVLSSWSASTKWLEQSVEVTGGAWYEASALQAVTGDGIEGLLRIAWYASDDASGSQLATVDSTAAAVGAGFQRVEIPMLQAPEDARSAQIRLLLRPASDAASALFVDDVRFRPGSAPAIPTPPPAPSVTPAAATPTATPLTATPRVPTVEATREPAAGPASGAARAAPSAGTPPATASPSPQAAEGAVLLRITELLPDPVEPGRDADFEWVELTNVDSVLANLEGLVLRDNRDAVMLPALVLPPGGSLVVAGPSAALPNVFVHRPSAGAWWEGLANAGDRVELLDRGGALLDGLSYGDDHTHGEAPAPAAGHSLVRRLDAAGVALGVVEAADPSPGVHAPPSPEPPTPLAGVETQAAPSAASPSEEATPAPAAETVSGGGTSRAAWIALGLLAVGTAIGAATPRIAAALAEARERRRD